MDDELEALQSIYDDVKVISQRCWEINLNVSLVIGNNWFDFYQNILCHYEAYNLFFL